MNLDQDDKGNAQCAVHIAVTDEQKCSKQFTAATTRIATDDAFTAGPASVPKKGQYAGAAWNENGPGPDPPGKDGGHVGRQPCEGNVRSSRAG